MAASSPPGVLFTVALLGSAGLALIFPGPFLRLGEFELKSLIIPLLQLIMFTMGTRVSLTGLREVMSAPRTVALGIGLQYLTMPLVAYGLAHLFQLSPDVSAGVILVGSVCAGNSSNVMTYFAGGNMALSVAMTTLSTLLAPVFTPTLMRLLTHRDVTVEFSGLALSILRIVVVPVIAGLIAERLLRRHKANADRVIPVLVITATCLVNAIIAANSRQALLSIGLTLIVVESLHNCIGYGIGYAGGRMFGLDRRDRATMAMQVGIRNGGLATGLAYDVLRSTNSALPSVIFGTVQNASGPLVASFLKSTLLRNRSQS